MIGNTLGCPIKKPWRIASNLPSFENIRRTCTHAPAEHTRCASADTKITEGYTDELATQIHRCFALHTTTIPGGEWMENYDGYAVDF
jgi:hypothetical protein